MLADNMPLDKTDYQLLESVKEKSKYLHLGRSPMIAIMKCWKLQDKGLLQVIDGWVSLTEEGRKALLKKENEF